MNNIIIIIIIILVLLLFRCIFYYPDLYDKTRNLGYKFYNKLCDFKLIPNQNEIEPNLWLGDFRSSLDKDFIIKNNIKLIINLSKNLNFDFIFHWKYC